MASRVSHSSATTGSTTTFNDCQCSTRTAPCCCRRRRRGRRRSSRSRSVAAAPSTWSPSPSASHSRSSTTAAAAAVLSLRRAGIMTMLFAGVAVAQQQQQQQQQQPQQLPAGVAAPASSPTLPPWTTAAEVERDLHQVADDLHAAAPMTVTHFTRQLDLVKRDPNALVEVRGTVVVRAGSGDAVAAEPAKGSSDSSSSDSSSASSTSSPSSSSSSSTAEATSSPLPSPFDDSPASIFKSSSSTSDACPDFMRKLLADPTFRQCYPLSMMLRTSTGFFQAEKQLVSIVRVLDATCAPDADRCADFMTQAAKNMLDAANCKKEYDANQGKVTDAFLGLRAYRVLRAATCLQDPAAQNYCFAGAVTNVTNPSDIFFYAMPLGLPLPGGAAPSCGTCTAQTMAIFHAATGDRSQKIAATYRDAARQVNTICGPGFVNDTATSAARRGVPAPDALTTLATVLFVTLLGFVSMAW
ncbi:C6 transcription factor [Cordyceps javanica]|uniref:C6 transcription factor n=1 Tax=Cordyceps javanica TaxID=43265 RepID=A0A545VD15_9HYPO|nr:C6 transcription factor [Cordyceps javanica]TQW10717.1 C6 transcription factor [Cordyceps javanica]